MATKGRGAGFDPPNRFETLRYEPDPDASVDPDDEQPAPRTLFLRDPARSIIATNQSPDVGFDASINPYRGCEHGCAYCYARPTHEYLGFSAGLDFETRILVKERAPELLRHELSSPRWKPQVIAISGVTDAYQPIERRLELTRRCLEVLLDLRNPVAIITKNRLVARDADLLAELARDECASVSVSVTTLDPALARAMEPRASRPELRLEAIARLAEARVPVGVLVAPIVPGLTDHEIPAILEAARCAGASFAGFVVLRLPHAVKELFAEWLARHFPERRDKVLNRVCAVRGGRLYDARFGTRQRGEGPFAEQIAQLFEVSRRRAGIAAKGPQLSTARFRRPAAASPQLALF
jgi:DNA repair photolyase